MQTDLGCALFALNKGDILIQQLNFNRLSELNQMTGYSTCTCFHAEMEKRLCHCFIYFNIESRYIARNNTISVLNSIINALNIDL